jgi:hypothetical protein
MVPSAPLLLAKPGNRLSVVKVYTASDGSIHLLYSDGSDVKPRKEKGQVNSSSPQVAEDRQTVGWLVEYPNCCTSYPISLTLVIYRSGKVIRRFSDGMLIAKWHFVKGGKNVAFYTDTVHGGFAPHYELRNVQTGTLLDKWDGDLRATSPGWTKELSR